jgi:hypothetical protein
MGLAWWAMPLFQLLMLADGSRPAIAPQTLVIGAVVAVGLLALLLWRLLGRAEVAPYAVALLAAASLAHGAYLVWYAFHRSGPDFWIHFKHARGFLRDGAPLYDLPAIEANHFGFAYKWPPLYAALLAPFVYQSGELVLLGHRLMNTLLLVGTAGLLLLDFRLGNPNLKSKIQNLKSHWPLAAAILMLFNFRPATDTIALGQFDIIALFCFTLALLAARRGRDGLAGALIAFLALIKLYPALLLAFFLLRRRWRALWGFALGGLACCAYSLAVLGWQVHWDYLTSVVGRIGGGTAWVENQTFNGFASRLFATTLAADKFDYLPVTAATYAFFALALGVAVLLAHEWGGEKRNLPRAVLPPQLPRAGGEPEIAPSNAQFSILNSQFSIQYSLFIILMIMAVPAAWMHYHAAAILPFAVLLCYYGRSGMPLGRALALALAYALISYGNQWSFFNGTLLGGLSMLGLSYKFYGLLLLFGVSVATLWRAIPVGRRRAAGVRDAVAAFVASIKSS